MAIFSYSLFVIRTNGGFIFLTNVIAVRRQFDLHKKREYVCISDTAPLISPEDRLDFILNYQSAVLLALLERKILNRAQFEQCLEKIRERRT